MNGRAGGEDRLGGGKLTAPIRRGYRLGALALAAVHACPVRTIVLGRRNASPGRRSHGANSDRPAGRSSAVSVGPTAHRARGPHQLGAADGGVLMGGAPPGPSDPTPGDPPRPRPSGPGGPGSGDSVRATQPVPDPEHVIADAGLSPGAGEESTVQRDSQTGFCTIGGRLDLASRPTSEALGETHRGPTRQRQTGPPGEGRARRREGRGAIRGWNAREAVILLVLLVASKAAVIDRFAATGPRPSLTRWTRRAVPSQSWERPPSAPSDR